MSGKPSDPASRPALDPTFLHARREAWLILLIWGAAMAWTVPYCYFNGYRRPASPAELELAWGMPAWVFWGILAPWMAANVVTLCFCVFVYRLDPLELPDQASSANTPEEHRSGDPQ